MPLAKMNLEGALHKFYFMIKDFCYFSVDLDFGKGLKGPLRQGKAGDFRLQVPYSNHEAIRATGYAISPSSSFDALLRLSY